MYGSSTFKWVHGKWDHLGFLKTTNIPLSDADAAVGVIPRGTWFDYEAGSIEEAALGSGNAIGVTVQDLDHLGMTGLQAFQDFSIGKLDRNILKPRPVSLRRPVSGAEMEVEGLGTALPGNLVCTSGTGSISSGTARKTELSVLNGCLRVAQSGDIVLAIMEDANLTPEAVGNVRILIRATGAGYVNP